MRNPFRNFVSDVKGVTLIEYGLIAALIAVALATVLGTVGTNLNTLFTTVSTKIYSAATGPHVFPTGALRVRPTKKTDR